MSKPANVAAPPAAMAEYFYIKIPTQNTELARKIFTHEFYGLEDARIFFVENDTLDTGKMFGTTDSQTMERVSFGSPQMGGANLNRELPVPYRYIDYMFHAMYEGIARVFAPTTPEQPPQLPQPPQVVESVEKSVIETPLLAPPTKLSVADAPPVSSSSVVYIFIKINPDMSPPEPIANVVFVYKLAEQLAKSVCRQLQIYSHAGVYPIPIQNNMYYVNGRFLLLEPPVAVAATDQPRAVGAFLQTIFPKEIKDTKLSYFIGRCIQENKLFWI